MATPSHHLDRGAIDLVEEAVHLLRMTSTGALACYYLGAMPFVLGFLFFWADMSRSPWAADYCAPTALGLAGLFIWMKCWQSVFTNRLLMTLNRDLQVSRSLPRTFKFLTFQSLIQASGLWVLPAALVVAIPFGWVYSFYQNVTVLGNGEDERLNDLIKKSWNQACLWPAINHLTLFVIFLFTFFVFINMNVAVYFVPHLLKDLFGIETIFTRSGWHVLNSTFLITVLALTYL
ncbi:MAG: hypothetical protein HQK55_13965, partial [Deltaproteobacteria bacterium]|nr:hypothetical protein [Deltaproteobacteria bacterium]